MNNASVQFEELLSRYFNQLLNENPPHAAYVGIDSARGKFGPATLAHEKRWQTIRLKALSDLEKISPREIESVILEHPAVLEAGVIGVPDEVIGQRITAYLVLKSGQQPSDALAEEICNQVREKIAPFKVPKEVTFVEALPRTATGKLMRRELRAKAQKSAT